MGRADERPAPDIVRRSLALALCCASAFAWTTPASAQSDSAAQRTAADYRKLDGMLQVLRGRSARDYAITTPGGIDEGKYVEIGGIEQWITIRGEDRANPVLLLLHGGPGDATNPWAYAGLRSWFARFTVVQWDQRGSGRSLGRSGPSVAPTITIDRMAKDGIELAEYLRASLGQDKIVLLGHSWGSILGAFMAKARPDLFRAFVATGLVADPGRNYAVAYADLLAQATRLGETAAVDELRAVGPPPFKDGKGFMVQRKWANRLEGADRFIASMVGLALIAPGYGASDINDWFEGQGLSGQQLVPQTMGLDARALDGDYALPVYVIQGAEDFTTPTGLAREFVARIRAPRKAFVAIKGAGHFAAFMRPEAFLKELVRLVIH